jgi:hypothetical protein
VDLHPHGRAVGVEEDLEEAPDPSRSRSLEIPGGACAVADEGVAHGITSTGGAAGAGVAIIRSGKATASSNPGSGARPLLIELFC